MKIIKKSCPSRNWKTFRRHFYGKQTHKLDGEIFQKAFERMRSIPGMPSMNLVWHPYESRWDFEVNYSSNERYNSSGDTATKAIQKYLSSAWVPEKELKFIKESFENTEIRTHKWRLRQAKKGK